jgi:hypothetical protein
MTNRIATDQIFGITGKVAVMDSEITVVKINRNFLHAPEVDDGIDPSGRKYNFRDVHQHAAFSAHAPGNRKNPIAPGLPGLLFPEMG